MPQTTALVIGGTSGIGLASARRLSASGATVHVAGRTKTRLDNVAVSDPALLGHQLDASNPADVGALAEQIGPIDYLVVTVAGSEGAGAFADLPLDTLRRVFDDKFWPAVTTIQSALPSLAQNASVTLLGAITARTGMPGTAGLAAVNGAVESLVPPLAAELAPIRVNAVSPGFVDTPWWDGLGEEAKTEYFRAAAQILPARKIATADDIAEVVVLAATNGNITGTVIEADAGARLVTLG